MSPETINDTLKDEELAEVEFEGELINALEELENSRRKSKALKEQLAEQDEETRKFIMEVMEQLAHQEEKCKKLEGEIIYLKGELHKENDQLNFCRKS